MTIRPVRARTANMAHSTADPRAPTAPLVLPATAWQRAFRETISRPSCARGCDERRIVPITAKATTSKKRRDTPVTTDTAVDENPLAGQPFLGERQVRTLRQYGVEQPMNA